MSKQSWREEPKISDIKSIDPDINPHKAKSNKKKFPPHWEIRYQRNKLTVIPSKGLKTSTQWRYNPIDKYIFRPSFEYLNVIDLLTELKLDDALNIYEKHHPETKSWPVRFINVSQNVETNRKILN